MILEDQVNQNNFCVIADRAVNSNIDKVIYVRTDAFEKAYNEAKNLYLSSQYLAKIGYCKNAVQFRITHFFGCLHCIWKA